MRLISGYRILYAAIVMGSYSRSLIIGSVVGLIGIGICLAIEQRWRNLSRAPSDRDVAPSAWAQSNGNQTIVNDHHPPSQRSLLNDNTTKQRGSTNDILILNATKEAEDDVTYLFRPLSNMSIQDKSWPGLPRMDLAPSSVVNLIILDDIPNLSGDTTESLESGDSLRTELQSDTQIDDNPSKLSWIRKPVNYGQIFISNEEIQTRNIIKGLLLPTSVPKMEEADISNTKVVSGEEQRDGSETVKNDTSDLPGPNINLGEGIEDQQEFNKPNARTEELEASTSSKEETGQPNASTSPLTQRKEHSSDDLPEFQSPKVEELIRLVDRNSNVSLSSGLGEGSHFSKTEKSPSSKPVENQLEEACSMKKPISSAPNFQDSPKRETKKSFKLRDNWPVLNKLSYNDLAAVPKKAKMKDKDFTQSKKDKDELQENPKLNNKDRVRKLVGFFENKS